MGAGDRPGGAGAGGRLGGAGARKRHGRHYTPERLARFLAERVLEHVAPGEELRVLDPACGEGELLLALHEAAALRCPGVRLRLVGYDLDAEAVRVARERGGRLAVEWHVGDFLRAAEELADDSFDAVITNPPYVRTQQLGSATARLLSLRFGLRGRIDLTHPFVASMPRLLRPGGVLGLLCANRFLTTKAGANLRALLRSELTPVELYDLGDTRLFEAAVLPAVTVAVRGRPAGPCRYVSAYELENGGGAGTADLFTALAGTAGTVITHAGRTIAVEVGTLASEITPPASGAPAASGTAPVVSGTTPTASEIPPASSEITLPTAAHRDRSPSDSAGSVVSDGDGLLSGSAGSVVSDRDRSLSASVGPVAPHGDRPPASSADSDVALGSAAGSGEPPCAVALPPIDPAVPWRMSRPGLDVWLRRVTAGTWRTFGEVARIRVGIKTTADRVFISADWARRDPRPEPELLFDLLTHHDLAPWRITRARPTQVLYPYDVTRPRRTPVDLAEFPGAAAYLAEHRDILAARAYVTAGGREWYEIWVPQRPHLWSRPKLVFPDISVRPRFALDRSGAIVNGDCYWISLPGLGDETLAYLLMGVANSTLGLRYYDAVCGNRLYAGRRRWITQYVARLPLPDPAAPAATALAELVRDGVDGADDPDPAVLDEAVAAAFGLGPSDRLPEPGCPAPAFGPESA
ncbi:methyltransferase domain-containing protein [Nocardia sp. BMG51109]|uniref:Eco57I restriction-modification methylase domain-containing protein n=1 Tax=Nocardia sp. BMG51109 TaxID=1056816 RepID=UPI0004676ED2|nr:methyltransferase domain-containing protein [Nocardia sp. BMG51109]